MEWFEAADLIVKGTESAKPLKWSEFDDSIIDNM